MTRVIKDPEERRFELIDMAERLFVEKGFEKTLVSDIVKELGVAQGTFYYYFKSKDDILNAILERKWERFVIKIKEIIEANDLSPLQKLQIVFGSLFNPGDKNIKDSNLIEEINDKSIINKFHQQFDEARIKILKPLISQIINQGIKEKVFQEMRHPEEVIDITFYGINMFMHVNQPFFKDKSIFIEKMSGLEEMLEKMLGIKKGSFGFSQI